MKKKDNLANDAAMFFLVAVISVSLSVFVSEVNTITRDSAAQAVGATSSTTYTVAEIQNQITALQAQIAALENTPQGATMMPALQAMLATLQAQLATLSTTPTVTTITDYSLLKNCFLKQKTAGGLCSITDLNSDGVTNFADIALAKATSGSATSTSPSTYDLNGDGKVNFIETVVTTTSSGSGTLSDLTLFKSCFFKTSPLTGICALSDFNSDGAINFGDLSLWKANNGSTSSSTVAKYDLNSDGKISYSEANLFLIKNPEMKDQAYTAGTNNVKLGSFILATDLTEGVNMNKIVVSLTSNSVSVITDLILKDSSNGIQIGTAKPSPSIDNSFLVNFSIPTSGKKIIDIYGNIKSGSNAGKIITTIGSATSGTGVVTGNPIIAGSDVTLQTITIGTSTLTLEVNNNSTPSSYNAVAGWSEVKVGSFRFTAQNSAYTVQELMIKIPADAATSVSAVTIKWDGGMSTRALAIPFGVGTHAVSKFAGLGFVIPENTSKNLDIYVSIASIASGASTGKAISVLIDADEGFKAVSGDGTVTTRAAISDLNSAAVAGKGIVIIRKSIPTLAEVALGLPALNAGANQVIGRFKIKADPAGDIGWKKISFTVNKTAAVTLGATTTLALWDGSNQVVGIFGTTTGSLAGGNDSLANMTSGNLVFVATNEQEIAAGTSKTYELRTTIGLLTEGSNVKIGIANPSTSVKTGTATGVAANTLAPTPSFAWTDRSSISTVHSENTSDWTNDYLIKTLPIKIGDRSVPVYAPTPTPSTPKPAPSGK